MLENENRRMAEQEAKTLLMFVNSFTYDADSFAREIALGHKTLQQSVMRLFIRTIREMAEVVPDERNEATVKLAKLITEIADDYSLPLI